ncbi:hypothetical protein GUITHDRAFT_108851 [Guillardia theta CCMP2712]|uniref:Uncharacterized protein n=2 Tax=Guillardia theta TaxID=55529 RepID=L1JAU2_GUITC|nr:hypothetical protein GUITHDRAFT_108851 [Guillardia theta CCMP2712]EKX45210.1 hypothetical protein GUITHDRAFT_108851 [Guillardia theta CCMP2712]|mmetsp:Transcript_6155/g.21765  ORF Transcript_6155/g.21765 Transcript_6155/m.21765 type:complete len:137 (+) Transcript_6155:491-901(+)|eukprot:XP_005832190.1 hypothetical protein GUITHDRAFT_108851 [Guillardia theta CCMP2712]
MLRCFGSPSQVRPENEQTEEELEKAKKKISELEGKLTSLAREKKELQLALQQATVKNAPARPENARGWENGNYQTSHDSKFAVNKLEVVGGDGKPQAMLGKIEERVQEGTSILGEELLRDKTNAEQICDALAWLRF